MIHHYKSPEATTSISAKKFFIRFSNLNNLKDFLPKEIKEFKSNEDSCSFKVSQLPKISLKIIEKTEYSVIKLQSKDKKIFFDLNCKIKEDTDKNKCKVTLGIDIKLNFMTKIMIEKPLNQFLHKLANQISKI
tara:strand:- start:1622 stop:2020 length:399 start_codon:yes stop_codon:yes gene_type:complete